MEERSVSFYPTQPSRQSGIDKGVSAAGKELAKRQIVLHTIRPAELPIV